MKKYTATIRTPTGIQQIITVGLDVSHAEKMIKDVHEIKGRDILAIKKK